MEVVNDGGEDEAEMLGSGDVVGRGGGGGCKHVANLRPWVRLEEVSEVASRDGSAER